MTLSSLRAFGFSFFWGHRCASSSLIFTRVCVQLLASEMANVVRVAHGSLRGCAEASRFGALALRFSVVKPIVRAMRHAFKVRKVVISRVPVYMVNMEPMRYGAVRGFPDEPMLVALSTVNDDSFISVRWERHALYFTSETEL